MSNIDNNWSAVANVYSEIVSDDSWNPGFEVDRQIVISKFGPYNKLFLRPEKYIKRFYHNIYPLTIEDWQVVEQVKLYDDFCTIEVTLDIRFQPTYEYAANNIELISELNNHIKKAYQSLLVDSVQRELLNLSDGTWVHKGLGEVEKKINSSIREMFLLQKIQSQVRSKLVPGFAGFPDTGFGKEAVHLNVLKKNYEYKKQQKEELFRQQQEEEKQKAEHRRLQLDQFNIVAATDREKQIQLAENTRLLLLQKEQQQLQQFEIDKRTHEEKVKHEHNLKEITLISEMEKEEQHQNRLRAKEEKERSKIIAHQSKLKERELKVAVSDYEKEKASWQKVRDQVHSDDLVLKQRQKQAEFDAEISVNKRHELKRLAMQKESYELGRNTDTYIKREIELLELEKKRQALQLAIEAKQGNEPGNENRVR